MAPPSLAQPAPMQMSFQKTDDFGDATLALPHKVPSPYRPSALQHTTTIVPHVTQELWRAWAQKQ